MSSELEEQQRLACELKEQLQAMEEEERTLREKIGVLEAKHVVKDLYSKVKVKREALNQLRNRMKKLEEKLEPVEVTVAGEQPQSIPQEKEPQHHFF